MPVQLWKRGEIISAERQNESVRALNTLVNDSEPPRQKNKPPGDQESANDGETPEPVAQIVYTEIAGTRVTTTVRVENPQDAAVFVEFEDPLQITFLDPDGVKHIFDFENPN